MYVFVWKSKAVVVAEDMAHAKQMLLHELLAQVPVEAPDHVWALALPEQPQVVRL